MPAAYIPFLAKNSKKKENFSKIPLANVRENSIIGAVPERRGRNEETKAETTGRKPARLPGILKESEMCLVTAQENFLEVKLIKRRESRPSLLGHDRAED